MKHGAACWKGRSRVVRETGFTLIELLVVITIIAIFAGMLLASGVFARDRAELRVAEAARNVERMLLEARNLAISTGKVHAVVFHIENAGSGRVMRNGDRGDPRSFPGRHWCAVIGPTLESDEIPRIAPGYFMGRYARYGSAQRLAATVEQAQVGERYYLPRGARFLALGDAEDNLHNPGSAAVPRTSTDYIIGDWSVSTPVRTGKAALSDTYPRPWFGYLKGSGTSWSLNAWGGYDPAIYGSGLDYECTRRNASTHSPIVNSTNTVLCDCGVETGRETKTPARNDDLEEMRPCCDASQLGKPRPVINGYWMDFTVVMLPNGQSRTLTFYNRAQLFSYRAAATTLATQRTFPFDTINTSTSAPPNTNFYGRDDAIIAFQPEVLGGTVITIAKDAGEDTAAFASPELALRSVLPMRRVIVNEATGGVEIIEPYVTIQAWLDGQERNVAAADRIWAKGYQFCSATDPDPNKIRVSGALTTEMLQQHDPYPWIKPKP